MTNLYHASPLKNLTTIKPKKTISLGINIGDFVFATSDKRLAAMYLATKGTGILLNVENKKPYIVICSNPIDYLANDEGGAIYKVQSSKFKKTPQKGLEKSEMISEDPVKPIDKEIYERSIDAMQEMGILIYFVDQKIFDRLVEAKDEAEILNNIMPYN